MAKKPSTKTPVKKITADDYLRKYKIDPNVERSNLTDEAASEILKKAAEALKDLRDKIEVVEAIKDGAYTVLQVLKAAALFA